MTICRQQRYRYIRAALIVTALLAAAFSAAGLSQDRPLSVRFELRLASMEKVEGRESIPSPDPARAMIWISPEAALTSADVAKAWPQSDADGFRVGILLTEDGALKLARLTKSHVGENVAVMLNGRVASIPKIMAEITGGRFVIEGNLTEEEARSLAAGIIVR
jgi:preprotein translocase subunit SecD